MLGTRAAGQRDHHGHGPRVDHGAGSGILSAHSVVAIAVNVAGIAAAHASAGGAMHQGAGERAHADRAAAHRGAVAQGAAAKGATAAPTAAHGRCSPRLSMSYVAGRRLLENVVVQVVVAGGGHRGSARLGVGRGQQGARRRAHGHAHSRSGIGMRDRRPLLDQRLVGARAVRRS